MSENIRKMIFSFSFEIGSRGKSVDSTDFSESWFLVGGQLSILAGIKPRTSAPFSLVTHLNVKTADLLRCSA